MPTIIIRRKKSILGAYARMSLFVNEMNKGMLKNGETLEYNVPNGDNVLYAKLAAGKKSKNHPFTISQNDTRTFNVSYNKYYFPFLLGFVAVFASIMIYLTTSYQLTFMQRLPVWIAFYVILSLVMKNNAIVIDEV